MKLCETQLIAEEDYKFARTHTFALLTMEVTEESNPDVSVSQREADAMVSGLS